MEVTHELSGMRWAIVMTVKQKYKLWKVISSK